VIFTGPPESADYFRELDAFCGWRWATRSPRRYEIVTGDAARVGMLMGERIRRVRRQRRRDGDAYYFNWLMKIPFEHQTPFVVDHASVSGLKLSRDLPNHELAVALRQGFSAIVTGNVKDHGIRMIKRHGPFELHADAGLMEGLDHLLRQFVAQGRMKLESAHYDPCYRVMRG
jgi:pyrimidine/purine-5'-nucleotide nucleosidase